VQADLVYLMLSDLAASSSVYDGEDGVLAALKEGKSLIDCATLTPERMVRCCAKMYSAVGQKCTAL
jgi:3-hydroxyisobutyrate dehydrogenase-like beta-hydroxyacid dehydrogenase